MTKMIQFLGVATLTLSVMSSAYCAQPEPGKPTELDQAVKRRYDEQKARNLSGSMEPVQGQKVEESNENIAENPPPPANAKNEKMQAKLKERQQKRKEKAKEKEKETEE